MLSACISQIKYKPHQNQRSYQPDKIVDDFDLCHGYLVARIAKTIHTIINIKLKADPPDPLLEKNTRWQRLLRNE